MTYIFLGKNEELRPQYACKITNCKQIVLGWRADLVVIVCWGTKITYLPITNVLYPVRFLAEISSAWDGCQKYFYRSLARHSRLQTALLAPAKVKQLKMASYFCSLLLESSSSKRVMWGNAFFFFFKDRKYLGDKY